MDKRKSWFIITLNLLRKKGKCALFIFFAETKYRMLVMAIFFLCSVAASVSAISFFMPGFIVQDNGLVPIVEPEILLDGDHPIERTLEVAERVWSEVFYYLAENNVIFEGILLKPSMVTPGAEHKDKASPRTLPNTHSLCLRGECLLQFQESWY